MEASQQFHLKWNNHSLNTLSSFQHLLDTNTLVDVSLTSSNGKTMTAHRMVLAACSDYFYRLFKDLPEKHPVIVFKDAGEEIVRDLLLFMYKGEVEVQESHLNDFLKFAETLQVKGLSQSDREDLSRVTQRAATTAAAESKIDSVPIKSCPPGLIPPPPHSSVVHSAHAQPPPGALQDMTKSYLAAAGLGKFPPLFPLPPPSATASAGPDTAAAADLLTHLSSPNLYRALHNRNKMTPLGAHKFPDVSDPSVLKSMPFLNLKKMFGGDAMAAAAADLAALYPRDDNDNDSIAERSPPPAHQGSGGGPGTPGPIDENGGLSDGGASGPSPMEADYSTPPTSAANVGGSQSDTGKRDQGSEQRDSDSSGGPPHRRGGSKSSAGRGSRLERMIAAEYKIMSEYAEQNQELPVMTPELMKSRRTHSLQLAIGEILHNRASVQSAATKYHIPRETLRRHYQRYLKAMGIQKSAAAAAAGGGGGANSNTVRSAVATNNNAKPLPPSAQLAQQQQQQQQQVPTSMDTSSADESSNGFSSLMDIGQAYGIWNNDLDGSDFKSKFKDEAMRRAAAMSALSAAAAAAAAASGVNVGGGGSQDVEKEDKDKDLVIDEDPGSPELDVGEEEELEEEEEEDGSKRREGDPSKETAVASTTAPTATSTSSKSTMETVA